MVLVVDQTKILILLNRKHDIDAMYTFFGPKV